MVYFCFFSHLHQSSRMNIIKALTLTPLLLFPAPSTAQIPLASPYTSTFNSTFSLSPSQIQATNLSADIASSVETTINFERSQLAHGGPLEDDFYTLPPLRNTSALKPGTLLKVQDITSPTHFAIPPNTALSRILYTTTNINGSVIPTSGFLLWPFVPRNVHRADKGEKGNGSVSIPVVVWTHGTSGFFAPQATSSHRALWYGHSAPFTLALAGYAVFAPDYAGLGVGRSWDGSEIPHQYHATPAAARDALFGLRAAREAFDGNVRLDGKWIVMGHSQGGAVAWGVAEALAASPGRFGDLEKGYGGAIAVSPTTDMFGSPFVLTYMLATVGFSLRSIFSDFDIGMWLKPLGVKRAGFIREVHGGIGVVSQLMLREDETSLVRQEDWNRTWHAEAFGRIGNAGGRDFRGPLLVIQGTEDFLVPYDGTARAVNETAGRFPGRDLEFLVLKGVGHTPVLDASRQFWLEWIRERMGDEPAGHEGFKRIEVESVWPVERYLHVANSVTLWVGLPEFEHLAELRL